MDHLKIEYLPIDDLKPYDRNSQKLRFRSCDSI